MDPMGYRSYTFRITKKNDGDFFRISLWCVIVDKDVNFFYWCVIVAHRDDQPIINLQPLLYLGVSIVMKVPLLSLDVILMENPY